MRYKVEKYLSDLFTLCYASQETVDHLFFQCVYSQIFCDEFESYWLTISKERKKLDLKISLTGVTDTTYYLFNYLIVLGKLHMWNCRQNISLPSISSYKELAFKRKHETKRLIAEKSNINIIEAK